MADGVVNVQVNAIGNFSNLVGEVGKFKSQLQSLKLPDKLTSKLEKGFDNVESKVTHFQSLLNKGITTKGDFSKLVSSARSAEAAINDLKDDIKAIDDKDIKLAVANSSEIKKAETALQKVLNMEKQLSSFGTAKGIQFFNESEVSKMQKIANSSEGLRKRFAAVSNAFQTGNIDQASAAIQKLLTHAQKYQAIAQNNGKSTQKWDDTIRWAQGASNQLTTLVSKANEAKAAFDQLQTNKFNQMKGSVDGIANSFTQVANSAKQAINAETEMASRTNQLNEQVSHLRTQANYFFGLQNMGRLIARGIREAAESVRDLDKAMTETAVVTDFSVSDMWNMLPEYTKLANELGATTQGAYETMTLYFQQGLDKQATFEIGEETMKMARIAGLDYAQTTNMMTAALRGFNMELNQTSAKRVNDVYSELAAITASDTRELGLAMERTASIAHSAGMDFGNTTAFLAQMIETTREAPENLGTAMKTIIARFQELKENPYQISEVEGEEVDFNRVDKALKTIGVDLMDNKDKFRDLDDVFMDISERWDGLSQTQQRYVATIAAGARQQSRFLAMVQNYDRLKQLTEAAANSEGASDVQFNKTLDSYEAKVNKLKNAWQAFTMSLANNNAIKFVIDGLKNIITFGNRIIQTFGEIGGIFGSVGEGLGEMVAAFGLGAIGFKGLKGGANLGLKMLGGMTVKGATMGGGMFPEGMRGRESAGLASKISNPIVAAINKLTSVVSGKPTQDAGSEFRSNLLKERRGNLYNTVRQKEFEPKLAQHSDNKVLSKTEYKKVYKTFSAVDVQKEFKDLSVLEQQQMYKSIPAIRAALQSGYTKAYEGLNLDKPGKAALQMHFKQIDDAVKKGQISANDAFKHLYNPASLASALSESAPEVAKQLNQEINKQFKSMSFEDKKGALSKARAEADKRQLKGEERKKFIHQHMAGGVGEAFGLDKKSTAQLGKVSGAMTAISSKAAMAGQSVMGLGMALDAVGLHGAGGALMTVGNGLIGIGMAAEGAVSGVQALQTALGVLKNINPALLAGSVIAAVGAAVVGGVMAYNKKMVKDTQKAGQRVVDSYTKAKEKTTTQLDNLKKYNENWDLWSSGVDENGNNVSLSTEEYQEYLKAVKDITSAHPELIKGYNAIGNAIVDNNTVLKKAAELTKQDQEEAFKAYSDGYDQIVAKQKTYKRWVNAMGGDGGNTRKLAASANAKGATGQGINATTANSMTDQANDVVESINKIKGGSEVLQQFGVEMDSTGKLTERGLVTLRTHLGDITNAVKALDLAPDEKGQEALDKMTEKANTYAKTVQGLEKVSKDTYNWGWEYASKQGYDKIEGGLVVPFQTAIERLAEKGLGQKEFEGEIDRVGQKYQDLGGHLTEFQQIQKDVSEAQKELGESADFDAYTDSVEVATSQMDGWIAELKSSTDEADHILAEYLTNQKEMMLDYSKQAEVDLSAGLNQDQALFKSSAEASKRYESMKGEITDYASGIASMKAILDDAMTDQNLEGNGSLAFEQASIGILGENFVNKNIDNIDKIKGKMEEYQGWLQDSEGNARSLEDTYTSFWDHITQKAMDSPDKTIEGIDGKLSDFFIKTEDGFEMNAEKWSKLTDEQMGYLAEQGFNMSSDFMSSMLNIGRQLGYYSSANIDMVRQGLIEQNGQGSAVSEGGTVYKRRSDLEEESRLAMNSKQETQEILNEASKAGIELIGDVSQMTGKSIKTMMTDLGVSGKKSGEEFGINFVKQFEGLNYNKEETSQAIDKALTSNNFTDTEKESLRDVQANLGTVWDKILDNKALGLDDDKSIEESIEGHTSSIDSQVGQMLAQEGQLSKEAYGYDAKNEKAGAGFEALDVVFGKKGKDTLAQFFATGKDQSGNALSKEQFESQRQQLENLRKNYQEQMNLMKTQAENTTGEEATWWTRQAGYYEQAINGINNYLAAGQRAHENKIAQNNEETTSDNAKTQNKKKNDQDEALSAEEKAKREQDAKNAAWQSKPEEKPEDKLLTDQEKESKIKSLFDQMNTSGEDPEQAKQKILEQAEALGVTKEQLAQLNAQAASFGTMGGLAGTLGDTQKLTLFSKGFNDVINNANLTDQQLTQLGTTLNGMSPDQLNNLTKADFGQLLSNLNLTDQQIQQLEQTNPEIAFQADTSEIKKAGEEADKPTKKDHKVTYKAATEEIKKAEEDVEKPTKKEHKVTYKAVLEQGQKVETQGANQAKQEAKQSVPTTTNSTITLNTTISNPNEPKEKIKAAIPKTYSGNVKASIKMSASVSTKGLKGQMQSAASGAAQGLKVSAGVNAKVGAKTTGKNEVTALNSAIKGIKGKTVSVKASVSGTSQVNSLKSAISNLHDKTVTVTYKQKGKPSGGGASGINNHIAYQAPIHGGSMAKGSRGKGQAGPNGRGGLTLTGEKGFEIAWLPSENRSMILGAGGPQMVSLPRDAVVWNNEQSKKIIKQKAILAGSMRGGGGPSGSGDDSGSSSGSGSGSGSGSSGGKGKGKGTKNKKKSGGKWKWVPADGDVSAYIYNIEKKIEQVKIKQANAQKKLNKLLKDAAATLKSIRGTGNDNIKWLNKTKSLNKTLVDYYNKQLKTLDKSKKVTIKYEQTRKKGKKTEKKTRKSKVDLGNYIYQDPETGAYQIDYKKINKSFKNKKQKQAIVDEAKKRIDDNTSKRDSAQQAIDDANDKLEEMGQQLYDTFFGWKNELTEIYVLTKQIESSEKRISGLKEAQSLRDAMIASGLSKQLSDTSQAFINNGMQLFRQQMSFTLKEIKQKSQSIDLQKQNISSLVSGQSTADAITANNNAIKAADASIKYQTATNKANSANNKVKNDRKAIAARNKLLKTTSKKKEKKKKKDASEKITKNNKEIKKIKSKAKKRKSGKLTKKEKNKITKLKNNNKKQKKKKNTATKNINTINRGNTAKKNLANDIKAQKARDEELKRARATAQSLGVDTSTYTDTELLAFQKRRDELNEQRDILKKANQFITTKTNSDGTIDISFDTEALEKERDAGKITEEMYNGIKEHYDELVESNENLQEAIQDQIQLLASLYEDLADLKEQYADYSEELLSATEEAQQKEIDKFEDLSKALSDALKDLLDEVKRRLEERRQREDNAEKEQDISQKQNRLAALRADTSGANASQIKQLEKEIAEAQKNYGRELEDQQLQRLQDQADKAAEQRERQIQLMSAELEVAKATGNNLEKVKQLIADAQSGDESVRAAALAEIEALWKANKEYNEQTLQRQAVLDAEFATFLDKLILLPQQIAETEKTIKKEEEDSQFLQDLNKWANETLTVEGEDFVNGIIAGQPWKPEQASAVGTSLGAIIALLKAQGLSDDKIADILKNGNVDYQQGKGYMSDADLVKYGVTDFRQLKEEYGKTNEELKAAGAKPKDLLELGADRQEVANLGYDAKDLRDAGFKLEELTNNSNYNTQKLKAGGYTVKDFKDANKSDTTIFENFSAKELRDSGLYSFKQLHDSGKFTEKQLKEGGYTATDFRNNNISYATASGLFSFNDLLNAGYKEAIDKHNNDLKKKEEEIRKQQEQKTVDNYASQYNKVKDKKNIMWASVVSGSGKEKAAAKYYEFLLERGSKYNVFGDKHWGSIGKDGLSDQLSRGKTLGYSDFKVLSDLVNTEKLGWSKVLKAYIKVKGKATAAKYIKSQFGNKPTDNRKKGWKEAFGKEYPKYATGGLADYTGPAWLDGTPSKPELVLNAQDTKNFMALRDVLDKAVGSANSVTNTNETAMYEININVDHINNDYDVDRIAARIKKDIIKDAGYRNVTQVRNFR